MLIYSSTANPLIKELVKIKNKKVSGQALIEGTKVVYEALNYNIVKMLITTRNEGLIGFNSSAHHIYVSEEVFEKLSSVKSSQGAMAVIDTNFVNAFNLNQGNFLVLDGIQDPGNLGTIIRTAVASGFNEIYAINCVDVFNDKVVRSTSGNIFKVCYYKTDYAGLEALCNKKGNYIISADLDGEDVFSFKAPAKAKAIGLVLGNEGNGVSSEAKKYIHKTLTIPMQGDVESLNVAVSGGIMMFNLTKGF